jgi:hypothetical protein
VIFFFKTRLFKLLLNRFLFQFDPLLLQVVHWFTRHGKYEREETMILLESIFDAMCDEEDAALR